MKRKHKGFIINRPPAVSRASANRRTSKRRIPLRRTPLAAVNQKARIHYGRRVRNVSGKIVPVIPRTGSKPRRYPQFCHAEKSNQYCYGCGYRWPMKAEGFFQFHKPR